MIAFTQFAYFNLYGVNSPQLAAISWSIPSDTPLLTAGFFIKVAGDLLALVNPQRLEAVQNAL